MERLYEQWENDKATCCVFYEVYRRGGNLMKQRLRILIISHYFPPLNSIASNRPYGFAKWLSFLGHDVVVLTTKKLPKETNLNLDCSMFQIIEVDTPLEALGLFRRKIFRETSYVASSKEPQNAYRWNFLHRFMKAFSTVGGTLIAVERFPNVLDLMVYKAYKRIKDINFDIMISSYAPPFSHFVAYLYKKTYPNCFWVVDYRDLWTGNYVWKGLFPFSLIERFFERKINTTADLITTVSEPVAERLRKDYNLRNVEAIQSGFDPELHNTIPKKTVWNDRKIRMVYTGSIYKHRDPSPLFKAIQNIAISQNNQLLENLEVVFVGGKGDYITKLAKKHGVSKWVKHLGFCKREESLRIQRDAHVLIFLESEHLNGVMPGKIFEYLFSGTQIWGIGISDDSEVGKIIKKSGCGANFGNDVLKIEKHLVRLLKEGKKPSIQPNTNILESFTMRNKVIQLLSLVDKYFATKNIK